MSAERGRLLRPRALRFSTTLALLAVLVSTGESIGSVGFCSFHMQEKVSCERLALSLPVLSFWTLPTGRKKSDLGSRVCVFCIEVRTCEPQVILLDESKNTPLSRSLNDRASPTNHHKKASRRKIWGLYDTSSRITEFTLNGMFGLSVVFSSQFFFCRIWNFQQKLNIQYGECSLL